MSAIDSNITCNTYHCKMQVSYCMTQCHIPGRNGKQCPDLAKFAAESTEQAKAIAFYVEAPRLIGEPPVGKALSNVFKAAFPELLPDGTAIPPVKVKPAPRPIVTPATPTEALPKAGDFLAKLPGYEPAKPEIDDEERHIYDTQSPPATEQVTEQVTVQVPRVTPPKQRRTKMTEDKPMNITSASAVTAMSPSVAVSVPAPSNAPAPTKSLPTRRKKVLPNKSGMNFFVETERDSNVFALLPYNNSTDALQALTGGDTKRRLLLAMGITHELSIIDTDTGSETP